MVKILNKGEQGEKKEADRENNARPGSRWERMGGQGQWKGKGGEDRRETWDRGEWTTEKLNFVLVTKFARTSSQGNTLTIKLDDNTSRENRTTKLNTQQHCTAI